MSFTVVHLKQSFCVIDSLQNKLKILPVVYNSLLIFIIIFVFYVCTYFIVFFILWQNRIQSNCLRCAESINLCVIRSS